MYVLCKLKIIEKNQMNITTNCKKWIDQVHAFSLPWHMTHLTRQAVPMELWGHSQDTSTKK